MPVKKTSHRDEKPAHHVRYIGPPVKEPVMPPPMPTKPPKGVFDKHKK